MHALKPVKKLKRNNEYLNVYSLIVKLPYRQLPLREFFYAVRIQVWWYINMFHWMLCSEVSRSWIIYKAKHDLMVRQLYLITITQWLVSLLFIFEPTKLILLWNPVSFKTMQFHICVSSLRKTIFDNWIPRNKTNHTGSAGNYIIYENLFNQ